MEKLSFEYQGSGQGDHHRPAVLVGVVASGNLEVLVESAPLHGRCRIDISTSVRGFRSIWQAVFDDFAARHDLSDLQVSVNDGGATPAVVSLRLDQAMEEFRGMTHE
jgi:malonate decarboxylase delta subunit